MDVKFDETTKKWGLYIKGTLIGDSKNRFDVDHAKQILLQNLVGVRTID